MVDKIPELNSGGLELRSVRGDDDGSCLSDVQLCRPKRASTTCLRRGCSFGV